MIKINKKKFNQHSNELLNIFNLLSVTNKYNIVDSYNTEGSLFFSDIDLNENIKIKNEKDINKVNKKFKKIFQEIEKNENIFFTDFKIGVDENKESLHWDFDEIKNGQKIVNDKTKNFHESLSEGTVKLDIIYRLNYSDFYEITMIYLVNPQKINLLSELKTDISEYLTIGRSFKALKRCFSYYTIKNNHKKVYTLIKLFNSDISIVAKVISEITIYITLLELYPERVQLKEIFFGIQNSIEYYLGCVFRFKIKNKIFKTLDKICKLKSVSKAIIELENLNDYFKRIVEEQTNVWIHYNKGIIPNF